MMSLFVRLVLPAIVLASVAGCGGLGIRPKPLVTHDFGPPSADRHLPAVPLRLIEVRAPSWLGSSAMQYRLGPGRDQRRQIYTENRWVAAPAELVEATLRRALYQALPEGGGCVLKVELDEFSQVFESAESSFGALEARATVVSPRADSVLAMQRFGIRVPAPTPNAAGGAIALRDASLRLAGDVDAWLGTLDTRRGGSLNIDVLCR